MTQDDVAPPRWWLREAACIARAESRNGRDDPNVWQFLGSTWRAAGGRGDPGAAPRSEQLRRVWRVYLRDGRSWREWHTARLCGLA